MDHAYGNLEWVHQQCNASVGFTLILIWHGTRLRFEILRLLFLAASESLQKQISFGLLIRIGVELLAMDGS